MSVMSTFFMQLACPNVEAAATASEQVSRILKSTAKRYTANHGMMIASS